MKNYKFLVPILLIVLFIGSLYMLFDLKNTQQKEYDAALAEARAYRAQDIQVDAEEYYKKALNQKPSIELYLEIGEFYRETNQDREATNWGSQITAAYPTEVAGYEFLMKIYDENEDYIAVFDVAEAAQKRKLQSPVIEEITNRLAYSFYFTGDYDDVGVYSGDMSAVQLDGKWGYVNQTGKVMVKLQYAYAGSFNNNLAPVTDEDGNSYFIDPEGNKKHVVLDVENIAQLGLIVQDVFSLYDGQKWHFYNKDHERLFGDFEDVSAMTNGIAAVKNGGVWQLVDQSGKDLTGKTYAAVAMDERKIVCINERLFVFDGSRYQMITSSGSVVGSDSYEDVCIFKDSTYAAVKINGKWGYVDKDGKIVIQPQYEQARSFSKGMAAVKQDGLWGFINVEGEMVIEPQFENAKDFNSNGCVFVFLEGEWKLLRLYRTNH